MPTPHAFWSSAVTIQAEPTTLSGRAAVRLAGGPKDSQTLMCEVCHVERITADAAERMADALLEGRPEFVRLSNGNWALRDDPMLLRGDASAPRDAGSEDPELSALSWAVVDVETTGTSAKVHDRITEISVVRVSNGAITDVYTKLVNPERSIPAFISTLTQITWDMVKDQQPFRHIAPDVSERLTGHVFTAHNAAFDWGFVSEELSRSAGGRLTGPRLCTVRLARVLLPQLARRSLDHVTRHFGIDVTARHRAEGDAVATAQVLLQLFQVAAERDITTWSGLMAVVGPMQTERRRTASDRRRRAFPHPVVKDDVA
ncbi:MAG: exonuclease domain-containing protein [Gemmatimonadota bacterium]|nr:exonuclease domain-containing protein [Gemmatimonadota bacterium]